MLSIGSVVPVMASAAFLPGTVTHWRDILIVLHVNDIVIGTVIAAGVFLHLELRTSLACEAAQVLSLLLLDLLGAWCLGRRSDVLVIVDVGFGKGIEFAALGGRLAGGWGLEGWGGTAAASGFTADLLEVLAGWAVSFLLDVPGSRDMRRGEETK